MTTEYTDTTVAIDPSEHVTVMHGPKKFGFVKSLICGLLSYRLADGGTYGLHAAFIGGPKMHVGLCGPHGAGKTTLSLMHALTEPGAMVYTDDWLLCERAGAGPNRATALELDSYLSPQVVAAVLEAIPKRKVANRSLAHALSRFLESASAAERAGALGLDGRLEFSWPDEVKGTGPKVVDAFIALNPESMGETPRDPDRDEFHEMLMNASYHIPFHSPESLSTLRRLIEEGSTDPDTLSLVRIALHRREAELTFWRGATASQSIGIFNTDEPDLWTQCKRFTHLCDTVMTW